MHAVPFVHNCDSWDCAQITTMGEQATADRTALHFHKRADGTHSCLSRFCFELRSDA